MSEKKNYAWPVISENVIVYHHILQKVEEVKEYLTGKRIAIFGAGARGCCLMKVLEEHGFHDIIFVDNNPEKQNNLINSYDIVSFESAKQESRRVFLVAPEEAEPICKQLNEAGLTENEDWFSFSFSAYPQYVEEYKRPLSDYLLVMGDCVLTHVVLDDPNFDSLGTMIRNRVGAERCKVLDMYGMGQQAYYHIAKSLIDRGEKPEAFLFPLIMETLSPKFSIMPGAQHPTLIHALVDSCEHPDPDFVSYADLAQERFDRFQLEEFAVFGNNARQKNEKLQMQVNYLFRYRETTEGVVYLKKTIEMMNRENIPVVLLVHPVNYRQGEVFFGENFKADYESNFKKLYETLDRDGLRYEVADASYLLDLDDFATPNTGDERCRYSGRLKIMQRLGEVEALKRYWNQ